MALTTNGKGADMAAMTVRQVADALGYQPSTVYEMIHAGEIVGVRRPGGHWRILVEEFEA